MKILPSDDRTEQVLRSSGRDTESDENKTRVRATAAKTRASGTKDSEESVRLMEDLKFFLATAPVNWQENQIIRRYYLNSDQGFVSCVFWNSLYYITGTDIVKCCMYRMQKFGREIVQKKKFEEGIFSDLRNLKCGIDATLEQPKSEFLSFLFRNMCLKTQKKQKVFFWFSVPHDKLFADALERDLKRENMDQPSTTRPISEPAQSFQFEPMSDFGLYDQLVKHIETQRERKSSNSVVPSRSDASPSENIVDEESSHASPLQLSTDIMAGAASYSPQMASTSAANVLTQQQQATSSPTTNSNYTPQKLVVVEPGSLELHQNNPDAEDKLLKDNIVVINDSDHGDFPLDYFPVEIENTNQDDELEAFNMQPSGNFMPMFHDNSFGSYEDEVVPATTTYSRFPAYPVHTPFPHPVSGTRSHFMTNAKYYSSQMKEKSESPNQNNKDFTYMKYSDQEDSGDERELEESDYTEQQLQHQQQQQRQQQAHMQHYLNPYQKFYNGSVYPSYFLQGPMLGGSSEMPGQMNEIAGNGYEEMFPLQDVPDQGFYHPHESQHNWNFVPSQAMQPLSTTSAYVPKPFTPNYRSTPMTTINPYMSLAQNGWPQPMTSPYGSKATSATSKAYPNATFYQQQGSSYPHRRPFQSGPTASKNYVTKTSKASKSYHRKNIAGQRSQGKYVSTTKSKSVSGTSEVKEYEAQRQKFSIPTPESNSLNSNNVNNDCDKEQSSDYTNSGFQKSLDDMNNSD